MERMKNLKETLMGMLEGQMCNLNEVDAQEMGEVVDMVKDLSEAIYYCSITKAMEDRQKEEELMMKMGGNGRSMAYQPRYYDGGNGNGSGNSGSNSRGTSGRMYYEGDRNTEERYREMPYPYEMRDYREGRSPVTRRMYMESKELHHGKEKKMQELEKYMKELTDDILEMIEDATLEEKQILTQKLSTLASKINV